MISQTETELTGYPSLDKPWLKYYSANIDNSDFQGNIWKNIYVNNKNNLDEIALLYFGKKISYRELFTNTGKAASAFAKLGVSQGDIVLLCMPAIPETIYSILALNKIGATANLLNPLFLTEQLADRMKETGAEIIVIADEVYSSVKDAVALIQIKTIITLSAVNSLGPFIKLLKKVKPIPNTIRWNSFINSGKGFSYKTAEYNQDAIAIVVYSSGTTGASKGIQLTNKSVNATIREGGNIDFEWKRQDRWMNPIPIWFSTGICASVLVPLKYGITVILEPQYDFEVFYKHIEKYKPNFMISAAGLYTYLEKNHYKCEAYKDFKLLVCGGEYVTPITEKRINSWLADNGATQKLHKGYGMCECGGTVTCSAYHCNTIGSAGIPTPGVVVSAFDRETNRELKYGERGELRVYSPCHMKEYFNNPKATDEFFFHDESDREWCCTGDMGYVTQEGSVFVNGRISDSYIREQKQILLFDIERCVLDIPEVLQCKAVASLIDGVKIHVCHIVIVKEKRVQEILEKIVRHCKSKLEENHIPYYFKIYKEQLPVSLSGKLNIGKMEQDIEGLKYIDKNLSFTICNNCTL